MARIFIYLVALTAALSWTACDSARPVYRNSGSGPGNGDYGGPLITESLFDYKERTLSEADIRQILDGKIGTRDSIRLAVFSFGASNIRYGSSSWFDEENLNNHQQLLDTLTYTLTRSPHVKKIIVLPALVTGARPNIQQLRESAVRLQADMLLVYNLNSELYQKYRAFRKDQARAYSTCETVLIDMRTGIIQHSGIVTKSAQCIKEGQDFTLEEMQKRALQSATVQTLVETGKKVVDFLDDQN